MEIFICPKFQPFSRTRNSRSEEEWWKEQVLNFLHGSKITLSPYWFFGVLVGNQGMSSQVASSSWRTSGLGKVTQQTWQVMDETWWWSACLVGCLLHSPSWEGDRVGGSFRQREEFLRQHHREFLPSSRGSGSSGWTTYRHVSTQVSSLGGMNRQWLDP